ncbi:hypothetical protein KUCAC02_021084 [Chaenocephalus aceratus]|uniref:Uncharacterized protein n=1 Tax=Chaenocephalus aceratus TaxID=36190 RepID=A0ACB9XGK0_CHAAC|nr:hypothetical protein KUCAC02_021084 [Chaenocephalus aceratus]
MHDWQKKNTDIIRGEYSLSKVVIFICHSKCTVLPPLSEHPGTSAGEKAQEYEDPTLQTALQEARYIIQSQNGEFATLREWVDIVTEERHFLRERLKEALALKKEKGGELAVKIPPGGQTSGQRKEDSDESDLSSSTESSDSDTESSEDKKPKKKKCKYKSKRKSQKKIWKNMRVKTPDHSIRRYNMVLEMVRNQGISKAEAYTRLGVDRNTIVYQAPIAEIAAVNPEL